MKQGSFAEFIKDNFYNEIYKGVESYYWKHRDFFRIEETDRVHSIFGSEFYDIDIKHVNAEDVDEKSMRVRFYPIVVATIIAKGHTRYDVEEVSQDYLFRLTCTGDISKRLSDFKIEKIEEFDRKQKLSYAMTDHLVPFIPPERLDEFALRILNQYYPEALEMDGPVDAYELAKRMGLEVHRCSITEDGSVFGRIYFRRAVGEIYNRKTGKIKKGWVEPKTVLIDKNALLLNACRNENITLAHECTHFALHYKAFEFRRLCDEDLTHIQCEVTGDIKGIERKSEASYMEYHATEIAPRIIMPKPTFTKKVDEFIKNTLLETGYSDVIDVIESVICQVADFYNVPKSVAKKRMVDAGYEEAIGALIYVDGRYVKPHRASKKGILGKKQTYSISEDEMMIAMACDKELYKRLGTGRYTFVDSHMVLNTPKYVEKDKNGYSTLTRYARLHMDECCLTFEIDFRDTSKYNEQYYSICVLNRDSESPYDFSIGFRGGYENSPPERQIAILDKTLKEEYEVYISLPRDFKGTVEALKKWRGVTNKELAEDMLVSEKTVERIINGETKTTINNIVAMCLSLQLSPDLCDDVIDKSPAKFGNTEKERRLKILIRTVMGKRMDEVREIAKTYDIVL